MQSAVLNARNAESGVGYSGPTAQVDRRNLEAALRDIREKAVRLRSVLNDISDHVHGPRPMPGHATEKQADSLLASADELETLLIESLSVADQAAKSLGVSSGDSTI